MSRISRLRAGDRQVLRWKNGGGRTTEIAVFPPAAGLEDFGWRVSVASVSTPGRFSHFGGVDRRLAVIEGRLALAFDGEATAVELTRDSAPHAFSGDAGVCGTPVGGTVLDLNLMVRRGHWTGAIEPIASPDGVSAVVASPQAIVLFSREGRLRWHGETMAMRPFDAVRIEDADDRPIWLESAGFVYILRLSPAMS